MRKIIILISSDPECTYYIFHGAGKIHLNIKIPFYKPGNMRTESRDSNCWIGCNDLLGSGAGSARHETIKQWISARNSIAAESK